MSVQLENMAAWSSISTSRGMEHAAWAVAREILAKAGWDRHGDPNNVLSGQGVYSYLTRVFLVEAVARRLGLTAELEQNGHLPESVFAAGAAGTWSMMPELRIILRTCSVAIDRTCKRRKLMERAAGLFASHPYELDVAGDVVVPVAPVRRVLAAHIWAGVVDGRCWARCEPMGCDKGGLRKSAELRRQRSLVWGHLCWAWPPMSMPDAARATTRRGHSSIICGLGKLRGDAAAGCERAAELVAGRERMVAGMVARGVKLKGGGK